ncbi:prepilin-type N-terminal cleavage/methylation domain-containing protein [Uliginosibacterium sp. 31-16]|uniref:type II secretion system protein n=1 Tax=Uliginosibacterium sp. 31-16 TaxID=3068315 RepID=UPI00274021E5|nr:prepilin-type N-terminal cleavage/methylation domain-containing protein [Uliginosibacterium sp. 31-16]MDP5238577.1 prepilin-type N-terminal cleavage/methylation domain-containing protein [Uliginosibacterium sp. 31-16]
MKVDSHKFAPVQGGFTLVELVIVLAIIGLILGALTVGKDVQRNAEYQKVGNKFVYEWKKAYDEYYQRAGVVLGDSQVAPTYMVNGGEALIGGASASTGNVSGALAGLPENYTNTGLRVCHGQGYPANTVGQGDPTGLSKQDLRELMARLGLRVPPGRGEGKEDRYIYTDSNGNGAELQICFQWNPPGTISGAGNVMVLRGLTPDLARYLDQLVDGKPDQREGRFRIQNATLNTAQHTGNSPGDEWAGNNTYARTGDAEATASGAGRALDEDRVVLLTAHWVMDQ